MTQENEGYPCPKGCPRTFKTNSAAHAHAVHCKFVPEPKLEEPVHSNLNPPEQTIVDRVTEVLLPQIEQGIVGLGERVRAGVLESLTQVLPQMVAQETQNMAGKIAEGLKGNPGGNTLGGLNTLEGINSFMDTPIGKLIFNKFLGSGSSPKGNINDWRRGAQLTTRLLGSNKSDPDATAQMIKDFAGPYKGKAGNDLYRGMYEIADIFRPAKKGEPKPTVIKEEKSG